MVPKIKKFIASNRERLIVFTAAVIMVLLFVYSSIANFDLAISDLIDAVFGCGVLAVAFWGWRLIQKENLTMEPGLIVSCAVVILPLLCSQRQDRFAESLFYAIVILMPVLFHAAFVFTARRILLRRHWIRIPIAVCVMMFGGFTIIMALCTLFQGLSSCLPSGPLSLLPYGTKTSCAAH